MAQKLEFIRQRLRLRGTDALTGLLDGPRARSAYLTRSVLSPPWSVRIADHAPLTVMAMLRGEGWILIEPGSPRRVGPGEVAIALGPEPYVVADDPATPPQWVIHPDQRARSVDGGEPDPSMSLGVRTWGNDPHGPTMVITGAYLLDSEVSRRLLSVLPRVIVLPAGAATSPIVDLLAAEIVKDEPGQDAILDRLLDLLLITMLRAWFSRPEAGTPGWYRAHADPVIGPALRLMYEDPSHAWTVGHLAKRTGASRAAFARRFTELVGEAPMKFLTGWRLAIAADLLRDPEMSIAEVAGQVGYADAYALSTAFKRAHGMSPKDYRSRLAP